jgi:DNA-binding NarL/FixJ family response regulator
MDVSMPDMGGIEATREIVENHPDIKVLALTMVKEKRYVVRMLQAGASGYLIKDCAFDEMAGAIRAVVSGGKYLCKEVTGVVIDDFRRIHADDEVPSSRQITAREREVLILLAQGQTTKNIADRLHLSVKTVETHRRKLMEKLKVKSIADLTRWAIREGLIDID